MNKQLYEECRICYRNYCLFSLCNCKGTIQYVCYGCFFENYRYKKRCEICHSFLTIRQLSLNTDTKLLLSVIFIILLMVHILILRAYLYFLTFNIVEVIIKYQEIYCFSNILFFNFLLVTYL